MLSRLFPFSGCRPSSLSPEKAVSCRESRAAARRGRVHTAGRPRVSGARRGLQPLRAPREAEDSSPQFGLLCPAAEDFSMFLHQQLL